MKLSKAAKYVKNRVLQDADVNLASLVVDECFAEPVDRLADGSDRVDFREEAVSRLIDTRAPFTTEQNTGHVLRKQILAVRCPYCETEMSNQSCSGSGGFESESYQCPKCHSAVSIEYPITGAVSVTPPRNHVIEAQIALSGYDFSMFTVWRGPFGAPSFVISRGAGKELGAVLHRYGKVRAFFLAPGRFLLWVGDYEDEATAVKAVVVCNPLELSWNVKFDLTGRRITDGLEG